MNKSDLLHKFAVLTTGNPGIESLVSDISHETIFTCLGNLETQPLSKVQLNQLLGLSEEKGVSDGFFDYYWLKYSAISNAFRKVWAKLRSSSAINKRGRTLFLGIL